MTTKTKLSIFAMISIVAISMVSLGTMLDSNNFQTTQESKIDKSAHSSSVLTEPENTPLPYEVPFRTGVPILQATPLGKVTENAHFHEVKSGESSYLWRAIEKGATPVSLEEMKSFFDDYEVNGNKFTMVDKDGIVTYWNIFYREPSIDLEHHWVKVFVNDPSRLIDSAIMNGDEKSLLADSIENQFQWVMIDDSDAVEIKQLLDTKGKELYADSRNYQVMYLGPLSDELDIPEIRAMHPVTPEVLGHE